MLYVGSLYSCFGIWTVFDHFTYSKVYLWKIPSAGNKFAVLSHPWCPDSVWTCFQCQHHNESSHYVMLFHRIRLNIHKGQWKKHFCHQLFPSSKISVIIQLHFIEICNWKTFYLDLFSWWSCTKLEFFLETGTLKPSYKMHFWLSWWCILEDIAFSAQRHIPFLHY